jgi:hypothetical protein
MGFRTLMMTADTGLDLPQWFVDKWGEGFNIGQYPKGSRGEADGKTWSLPVTSKGERKFYSSKDEEIFADLQKALNEQLKRGDQWLKDFEIVLLHECDGITKVHIGTDFIKMYEPEDWHEVEEITHNYCYGCSTPPTIKGRE